MHIEKPINKLINDFISDMDSKEYVQENTKWVLNRFVKWMVQTRINVKQPRRADIIHYKNVLISENKTPTTVNRYLAPIRTFFAWLEQTEGYTNIAAGIKSPKDDRQFRKEYLNPEQVNQLLDSIQTNRITGKRDYAMINLMVCTGLRRVEVLRLRVADLDSDRVMYVRRKGRTYKQPIQLQPEIFNPIEDYLLVRQQFVDSDPLFANHSQYPNTELSHVMFSKIVKGYLKRLNTDKKLTCHSLRHSAAINLLKAGKDIYDVQQLLGHSTIHSTQAYLKAIEAERRFNNPLSRDLIDIYRNTKKPPKNTRITA